MAHTHKSNDLMFHGCLAGKIGAGAENIGSIQIWSNYSDLTRPGPPKGSFLEGKWDPCYFRGNLGWWNIIPFGQIQIYHGNLDSFYFQVFLSGETSAIYSWRFVQNPPSQNFRCNDRRNWWYHGHHNVDHLLSYNWPWSIPEASSFSFHALLGMAFFEKKKISPPSDWAVNWWV